MRKAVAMALALSLIASPLALAQRERRPPSDLDHGAQVATDSNTLPSGTVIIVRLENKLDSGSSLISDRFRTRIFRAVTDGKGRELIPQGAFVEGFVNAVKPAQKKRRSGLISVTFDTLRLPDGRALPITANLTSADPEDRKRIDDEGNIIYNRDFPLYPYEPFESGREWRHDTVDFPFALSNKKSTGLALGIYNQGNGDLLAADLDAKSKRDWNGLRILVPIAKEESK